MITIIKTTILRLLSVVIVLLSLMTCDMDLIESERDQGVDYTVNINGLIYRAGDTLTGVGKMIKTDAFPDRELYAIHVETDDGITALIPMDHPDSNGYYLFYPLPKIFQFDSLWVTFRGVLMHFFPTVWPVRDTPFEIMELEVFQPADSMDYVEYYPLALGNQWTFSGYGYGNYTFEVSSICQVGKHVYYVTSTLDTVPEGPYLNAYSLIRSEDGRIYRRFNGQDYLSLDFTRPVGEKWQRVPFHTFIQIVSKEDTVYTNIGTITNCIRIITEDDIMKVESLYAPGIGPVYFKIIWSRLFLLGYSSYLQYAVIDGEKIVILPSP